MGRGRGDKSNKLCSGTEKSNVFQSIRKEDIKKQQVDMRKASTYLLQQWCGIPGNRKLGRGCKVGDLKLRQYNLWVTGLGRELQTWVAIFTHEKILWYLRFHLLRLQNILINLRGEEQLINQKRKKKDKLDGLQAFTVFLVLIFTFTSVWFQLDQQFTACASVASHSWSQA